MSFVTFDVWDQAVLTDIIRRPPAGRVPGAAEDTTFLGASIAPMKSLNATRSKVRVSEIQPFGKGQFRAPDATPMPFKPAQSWNETIIDLAILDEWEFISEEDWIQLNSPDENIQKSVGLSLVDKGRILKLRNERATEWLRWQAFRGEVTIPYDQGNSTLYVNYGLQSTHKPVASTLWSSTSTADPVTDIQAWAELIAVDTGYYGKILHMNSKTYNYLVNNTNIKNQINFYANGANSVFRPRKEDILNLFTSFAYDIQIVIYDNGYRNTGETGIGTNSLTKYLPDGYVLMTTDYTIDGTNIADVQDGLIQVPTGYNTTAIKQGEQAWVHLDDKSGTHWLRYASRRIPRILIPDAFVWAQVA